MNYEAGIIAFLLLWIPAIAILVWMHRQNKKIDQDYENKLAEIRKRYGVDSI